MESIEKLPMQRVTKEGKEDSEDIVIREVPLTVILNNQELVTLLCSPKDLEYLAVGFLASEGLLKTKDEVKKTLVDDNRGIVRVETAEESKDAGELLFKRLITSGCGRGASFYNAADAQGQKIESLVTIAAS